MAGHVLWETGITIDNTQPKINHLIQWGLEKCLQESHFSWYLLQIWNINSWDMWLSTQYFSGLLQDWFHVFLYEIKKNSVWYNFYQGTSVSITFYIFEHHQLWMMDSKGQRVFFPKTPQLCMWHTEVRSCYHFKLVSHFQLWFPIWGVQVNRLKRLWYYWVDESLWQQTTLAY